MARDITTLPPVAADRRIPYGDDPSQFFDLHLPKPTPGSTGPAKPLARRSAVNIHGGYCRAKYGLAHASHLCAALAAAGIATANLEYRRVGSGVGGGGGWPASLEDLRAALTAAREHLPSSPVVLGHSAGGHLALRLAADVADMPGVVALAPVADLQLAYDLHLSHDAVVEFIGGTPAQKPDAYAAADAARHPSSVPRTLIHGTHDDVVPIALTESFIRQRHTDKGTVKLVELAQANHFDLIDPASQAWADVLKAVQEFLG